MFVFVLPGDHVTFINTPASSLPFENDAIVRSGKSVRLQKHVAEDEDAFIRWYTDAEIAHVLRHDLRPLTSFQAHGYFSTIVLPNSAHGTAWAIHEISTGKLIGTTAITEIDESRGECLFRIVIGEKSTWGKGYGTEATRLVVAEAFERFRLRAVNLEVFQHNPRAIHSYEKVGFVEMRRTIEWARDVRLDVIAMRLEIANWDGAFRSGTH